LPTAAGPTRPDQAEDRHRAPGLQRRRAHLRQRARDRPDEHRRRDLQLRATRILRGRGAGRPGGATRAVLRAVVLAAAVLLALLAPGEAAAKSFYLPGGDVHITVENDGGRAIQGGVR